MGVQGVSPRRETSPGGSGVVVGLRAAAKRYRWRGPWVLRDVDVALAPGAVVEVRGANGTGKSTLLRLLAGATVPTRGQWLSTRPWVWATPRSGWCRRRRSPRAPTYATTRVRTHVSQVPARLAGDLASVLVFTLAVALVCARLWRRRE